MHRIDMNHNTMVLLLAILTILIVFLIGGLAMFLTMILI